MDILVGFGAMLLNFWEGIARNVWLGFGGCRLRIDTGGNAEFSGTSHLEFHHQAVAGAIDWKWWAVEMLSIVGVHHKNLVTWENQP